MTTTARTRTARNLGLWVTILGIVFIVSGIGSWVGVSVSLGSERITVSDDAPAFGGQRLDTPWEAWAQAEQIKTHALAASEGQTFAQLDRENPVRETLETASFLRTSLLTSVIAFGISLLVLGVGLGLLLTGLAIRALAPRAQVEVEPATATEPARAGIAPASPAVA
ncbi:aromatic ring-opening dioxygenase LigA [Cellulomonas palmilytica]|uniref:aromatic ring-opening dioxygenase LigA n=1 Tax=Cellulomonas palmilytica TaxID=2608402 RepID=UPI001F3C4FD2|nr:aromatic ring-opening dioxygenase LigA [Cellulomonas palmilytica]UJP39718.1 aromatic ring-opening dioxygenase LigA [Cellulomonas palmilytica]